MRKREVDIPGADPQAVARLAASDRESWQRLVERIHRGEPCPEALVRALLAIDAPEGWPDRIHRAYAGAHPDEGYGAFWAFRRWFADGIVRHLAPGEPVVLRVRLALAMEYGEADAATVVRGLVGDIERAGDSASYRGLLGRALLLLARRSGEDLEHEAAIAAARRAEEVFAGLGDATWRAQAVRMRGAALLRMRRIDEALEVLDSVAEAPGAGFSGEGSYRFQGAVLGADGHYHAERELDAIDACLDAAAKVATWAKQDAPEWIAALGELGECVGHRGCAERSAAGQAMLAERSARERAPGDGEFDVWDQKGRIV